MRDPHAWRDAIVSKTGAALLAVLVLDFALIARLCGAAPDGPPKWGPPRERAPRPVYYANCAEAVAAGVTPLLRAQPGYRAALDRNGDGVACE